MNHFIVLGVGLLIGLGVAAIVTIFESQPQTNRPYSQRRSSPRRTRRSPSPPPAPRKPTNTEPTRRAASSTKPAVVDPAPSTTSRELAERASSPISPARHFRERCSICNRSDREVVAFQPCGDYVMCKMCAEEFTAYSDRSVCPYCNTRIEMNMENCCDICERGGKGSRSAQFSGQSIVAFPKFL